MAIESVNCLNFQTAQEEENYVTLIGIFQKARTEANNRQGLSKILQEGLCHYEEN